MSTILELKEVSKVFLDGSEKRTILDSVNLTVSKGEFVAILGPSGSGKSTLLSIAGQLLSFDSGMIKLNDKDISNKTQKEWTKIRREMIGFIFQNHQLLPYLTIFEQLKMAAQMYQVTNSDKRIMALLSELGIAESANHYPKQLSGGQKQRAAIARAFLSQPPLILADEPTASLDEERGRQIAELIHKEVKENQSAAVMVTHDERILDLVDHVYRLQKGKLVQVK